VFFRTPSVSLELGRNNIWLGHGRHGSLLLSNNAEPYTLVRFRTERPFQIPYIGNFDYTLFHGWPREFHIIGHQLSWYPASWFEFNIKQTIVYTGNFTFGEYVKMFTGRDANIGNELGTTDSRASFEIALNAGFFSDLAPIIKDTRVYVEYAGEDLYAKWQRPDARLDKSLWVGPFGFELLDTGLLTGIEVVLVDAHFIAEYAQNYKSHYLFYDPYNGNRPYNSSWYRHWEQPYFKNNNALMGHHMGTAAEIISLHYKQSLSDFTVSLIMSRRHRWNISDLNREIYFKDGPPERQDSFAGSLEYHYSQFTLSVKMIYNTYNNTDRNQNSVINNPSAGETAQEFLAGIAFTIYL